MRIAVMGAGALGCYIGGRLAVAGRDVSFVARGTQLDALDCQGLRIESPLGNARIEKVFATPDPKQIGAVELIVFLVKLYDTETAARTMMPLLSPKTSVVSFQNGVDGWERIGSIVGRDRIIGGVARLPCAIQEAGVVEHKSGFAKLHLGELDGTVSDRCREIQAVLDVSGLEVRAVADIEAEIWEKFDRCCRH